MFGFQVGAVTNVGVQRDLNQDSYATATGIVVVADGMGGHRGGEVASAIAARQVAAHFNQPNLNILIASVEEANRMILDEGALHPQLNGMGTTVVALALIEVADGIALGAVNVGDSRMYRLTGNVLEQLTEDHSLVEVLVREGRITAEEAEIHPQRNIVTRALGVVDHVEVDSFHFIPKLGDRYLLCSDGLFNEVDAQGIATILASQPDPQLAAEELVAAANDGGGRDNITTVIADIVSASDAALPTNHEALAAPPPIPESEVPTGEVEPVRPAASTPSVASAQTADAAPAELDVPDVKPPERPRWSWRR